MVELAEHSTSSMTDGSVPDLHERKGPERSESTMAANRGGLRNKLLPALRTHSQQFLPKAVSIGALNTHKGSTERPGASTTKNTTVKKQHARRSSFDEMFTDGPGTHVNKEKAMWRSLISSCLADTPGNTHGNATFKNSEDLLQETAALAFRKSAQKSKNDAKIPYKRLECLNYTESMREKVQDDAFKFIKDLGPMTADACDYSFKYHVSSRLLYHSMINEVVSEYQAGQKSGQS
jgi:hypothetical protein